MLVGGGGGWWHGGGVNKHVKSAASEQAEGGEGDWGRAERRASAVNKDKESRLGERHRNGAGAGATQLDPEGWLLRDPCRGPVTTVCSAIYLHSTVHSRARAPHMRRHHLPASAENCGE